MKPIFSFGIITDCQYADIPDDDTMSDRRFRLAKNKLQESVDFFNQRDLEFVVHLGDLIDGDLPNFDAVIPICNTSKAPFLHVLGNHDFYGLNFSHPGEPQKVMEKLGLTNGYYCKVTNGYRFIILDTNEEGIIKTKDGSKEQTEGLKIVEEYKKQNKLNAMDWTGRISVNQHKWLNEQLSHAKTKKEKVIIFSHHGLYPKHRENMLNDKEMLEELSQENHVKAYINGHNHDGDYGEYKGLHCLTVHGMVDTGENAYALAHVYPDRIQIEGFGREPSRTLQLR